MLLKGADLDQDGCPDREDVIAIRLVSAPAEQQVHVPPLRELFVDGVLVDLVVEHCYFVFGATTAGVIALRYQVHQVVVPRLSEIL